MTVGLGGASYVLMTCLAVVFPVLQYYLITLLHLNVEDAREKCQQHNSQ